MNFVSSNNVFEEMLGDIKYDPVKLGLYSFMLRVGVSKYRPPRHPFFEYMIHLGEGDIENILYHTGKLSGCYTFIFPERHMSVHEQRAFMSQLNTHPTADKIIQVDIITSSAIMISDFFNDMIQILTWEDDNKLHPFVSKTKSTKNSVII